MFYLYFTIMLFGFLVIVYSNKDYITNKILQRDTIMVIVYLCYSRFGRIIIF